LTIYFSQGSVATDVRGGGRFNSIILRMVPSEINSERIMKIGPCLPTLS